jgi:hypothetical protein
MKKVLFRLREIIIQRDFLTGDEKLFHKGAYGD